MSTSLRRVFMAGAALGIVVPALMLGALSLRDRHVREIDSRVRAPMVQYTEMLADSLPVVVWNFDAEVAEKMVKAVMRNPDVVRVSVFDQDQRRFVHVQDDSRQGRVHLQEERALIYGQRTVGRVMVEMSTARLEGEVLRELSFQALALLAQVVVSLGFILWLFERRLMRPLKALQYSARRLSQGEMHRPIAAGREDEIGNLAQALEHMRSSLAKVVGEREQQNAALQQELQERQRVEEALRVNQDKTMAIFHASPVPMTVSRADRDFAIEDVNDAFTRLFGNERAFYLGRNGTQTGLWADLNLRTQLLREASAKGYLYRRPAWMVCAGGRQVLCEISGRMLRLPGQSLAILSYEDVTQRHQGEQEILSLNATLEQKVAERTQALTEAVDRLDTARAELVRSEKLSALGALVAGIAHELNTPIGVSVTVASALHENTVQFEAEMARGLKRSTLNQYVGNIKEGSDILGRNLERAAALITSFKQVAVDQTSVHRRSFPLDATLSEILLTLGPTIRKSRHQVVCDIPPDLVLDSYPGPLAQIVTNLIHNAFLHGFEAMEAGVVTIQAEADGDEQVWLRVRDNGCGIPPDDLGRIFDPFFTTKLGRGGSGLGLNIVHNLVTQTLGGSIQVESQPGQGTVFTLHLPRVAPEPAPAPV